MDRLHLRAGAALALVLCASTLACSLRGTRTTPLPPSATAALADARQLLRQRPEGWRAGTELALTRAAAAAPGWIAPARVRDDLWREQLLGHVALAERRAELAAAPGAAAYYLAGRLEGRGGYADLERAARLDPGLSWGQHGLAWLRYQEGDVRGARQAGRRALALARGSYELGTFATALARFAPGPDEARELLAEVLADARLAEPERSEVALALARAELASDESEPREQGFWRGVGLLEEQRLTGREIEELGELLLRRRLRADVADPLGVLLSALPARGTVAEERLRARVLLERGAHALAGAAWERGNGTLAPGPFQRQRDLLRGAAEEALARWNAALPARLRAADGLPREPALRALVLAARETQAVDGAVRFGAALLAAGWFDEAESWASALAARAPAEALALASQAAAGQALLAGVRDVLERLDEDRPAFLPARGAAPGEARALDDLEELLAALEPHFARQAGAPTPLVDSPRLSFGALASIVHPGPSFSTTDERAGRGAAGAPVPGLAAELARLGRFGIFGAAPGTPPDGTVLRSVGGEWKEGAHLGVPFAGWVAWCEGADVESRPGRLGSGVSGAALHEGYWIDLESVRRDHERALALEATHLAAPEPRLAAALAGRGPLLPAEHGRGERARWLAPLGEGERVLLAVLAERAPGPDGTRLPFDEWLDLTVLHEEGHLTDRTRFLPLIARWPSVLGFLLRHGFTPRAVSRALEYRAQLVALCTAAEPRLVLAECLQAADSEGGVLPHGEAYRELLGDFLAELAALPEPPASLDEEHYLVYQLHVLPAEDVRRAARALAARHGMLAE
ncbi:MAG TPA: hypothetical protein VF530_13580 [Planctomycetota bacterium]